MLSLEMSGASSRVKYVDADVKMTIKNFMKAPRSC